MSRPVAKDKLNNVESRMVTGFRPGLLRRAANFAAQ